jgi:hypothetical protein
MTRAIQVVTCVVMAFFLFSSAENGNTTELTGSATVEGRLFPHSPVYKNQKDQNGSLALITELYQGFPSGSSVIISPFVRFDSSDPQRTHFDFRELSFLYLSESWEITTGISRVYWGATEFVHLVDIINQTDLVESLDGEDKLGQPMLHLAVTRDWGVVEGFLLPYFRERTFPGKHGRLHGPLIVDTSQAAYESGDGQHHIDVAARYSCTIGMCDLGISQFIGTGREPTLNAGINNSGESVLIPYYPQISQTGIDLQMADGEWLWKGEAIYRSGQGRYFAAATFGFEYTIYGFFGAAMDLGIIGEYTFDDRDETVPTPYDNDLMLGFRWMQNDVDDMKFLAGIIKDLENSSLIFTLEGSRRLGESAKVEVTAVFFAETSENDPVYFFSDDDFIKVEIIFYF